MKYSRFLALPILAVFLVSCAPALAATRTSRRDQVVESFRSRSLSGAALREAQKLQKEDKLDHFPIPVLLGVTVGQISDTWGDARSNGRTHEGNDILAPRNAYIVAPSDSVVSQIGVGANGGNYVYTINPGGERYYFAHLDHYADGLKAGQVLEKGDLIGYVGNTGNASGGPTHLHLGIYAGGAQNPFPRLTEEFTTQERLDAVEKIVEDADDEDAEARIVVGNYPAFFRQALAAGFELPDRIAVALASAVIAPAAPAGTAGGGIVGARDLTLGARGTDVIKLQQALIGQKKGAAATALAAAGATGYFGPITQKALAEYQAAVGISPAAGYFGPLTRGKMTAAGLL